MRVTLMVPGAPRSKKTHNQIVSVPGFDKRTGQPRTFQKVVPSEQYAEWFKQAMSYAPIIRNELSRRVALPITGDIEVSAKFYREAAHKNDLTGLMQALGDWLQSPKCSKKDPTRRIRDGAGIIADDSQIVSWDGTRMLIDRARPRIEVTITADESLFDEVRNAL